MALPLVIRRWRQVRTSGGDSCLRLGHRLVFKFKQEKLEFNLKLKNYALNTTKICCSCIRKLNSCVYSYGTWIETKVKAGLEVKHTYVGI